jgi:hypothetical protein
MQMKRICEGVDAKHFLEAESNKMTSTVSIHSPLITTENIYNVKLCRVKRSEEVEGGKKQKQSNKIKFY